MTLPDDPIRAVRHAQPGGHRTDHSLYTDSYDAVMPMDYFVRQVRSERRTVAVTGISEALAKNRRQAEGTRSIVRAIDGLPRRR